MDLGKHESISIPQANVDTFKMFVNENFRTMNINGIDIIPIDFSDLKIPKCFLPQDFHKTNIFYGVDQKNVYYKGKVLENLDPSSFSVVYNYLAKAGKQIILNGEKFDKSEFSPVPRGRKLGQQTGYFHVRNKIFHLMRKNSFRVADNSFKALDKIYATDDQFVYAMGRKLNISPVNFQVLSEYVVKNRDGVFVKEICSGNSFNFLKVPNIKEGHISVIEKECKTQKSGIFSNMSDDRCWIITAGSKKVRAFFSQSRLGDHLRGCPYKKIKLEPL